MALYSEAPQAATSRSIISNQARSVKFFSIGTDLEANSYSETTPPASSLTFFDSFSTLLMVPATSIRFEEEPSFRAYMIDIVKLHRLLPPPPRFYFMHNAYRPNASELAMLHLPCPSLSASITSPHCYASWEEWLEAEQTPRST